ncbi:flavodoxin family protein [Gymnodinialimonas sp. 2305UL16-5]|uniref:flavodoxin family protein n=1 Tax=Gymnodinialimonas mytili TaxID=3126503 RepID=UPI0030AF43CA
MIAIPYFSGAGHTAKLAQAIADGAGHARAIDIEAMSEADWAAMDAASAIVFGAPTYMGSVAARYSAFLEDAAGPRWMELAWADKLAGGFTVASHGSGDKGVALQRLNTFAAQMGMIWVGQAEIGAPVFPERAGINTDGSWLGLMATSSRDKSDLIAPGYLDTAYRYGARIAGAVARWG